MAQYGDPYNPASSQGNPRPESSSWGASSSDPSPAPNGFRQDEAETSAWNADPSQPSWELNSTSQSSITARRRNQWRQYRHMTPDFGLQAPVNQPDPPVRPVQNASLPRFKATPAARPTNPEGSPAPTRMTALPPSIRPQPSSAPQAFTGGPTQGRRMEPSPLQLHPHSTAATPISPGPGSTNPASPANLGGSPVRSKVTPLRPLPYRGQPQPSPPTRAAALAVAGTAVVGKVASEGEPRRRPRPSQVRRRLAKPPLPLLYLIRMVILGVGVAAIAGTLLSVLSPSNLASSPEQGGSTGSEAMASKATGALIQGGEATTVTDIQMTSELTRLKAQLEQLVTLTPRLTPTVFLLDLDGGRYVDLGGADVVAAASTIKVPILVAFLQQVDAGNIALNQGLTLQEAQVAGGSGDMRNDAVGTQYTALEVATRMIITSDNTATNMMIAALGGPEALNQTFADWGLGATVIRNPLPDIEGTNTTSAKDLSLVMALVDQGGLISPRSRDRMFGIMQRTVNRALIPSGLNDTAIVANKTGDIGMMLGDVALVDAPNGERYALTVLVQRPDNDGRASELIRRMTEAVHSEINQPVAPVGGSGPTSGEEIPTSGEPAEPMMTAPDGTVPQGTVEEVTPPPAGDEVPQG